MKTNFKTVLAIVFFPLLLLLGGCNSEGAFSESTESSVTLKRIDIVASPITTRGVTALTLAKDNHQPFVATGFYSDGSSRVLTNLGVSDWHTSNPDAGHFQKPGVFTAIDVGHTTIKAMKDGVSSNTVDMHVTGAFITEIQVTPSPVYIAKKQSQQLIATATYSDSTTADVSSLVEWIPVDTNIATVSSAGLLLGLEAGKTTLTVAIDGVNSNDATVEVCADFSGKCIDIFDTGSGKLFTNSPSVLYLGTVADSLEGMTYEGYYQENGNNGPAGFFNRYTLNDANALCEAYNSNELSGRSNWRLATKDELLIELYDVYGNMFLERGWPIDNMFWTATSDGDDRYVVDLVVGDGFPYDPSEGFYASCVSNP